MLKLVPVAISWSGFHAPSIRSIAYRWLPEAPFMNTNVPSAPRAASAPGSGPKLPATPAVGDQAPALNVVA
jgi:hypothetical protein